jgi:hypothetical protein
VPKPRASSVGRVADASRLHDERGPLICSAFPFDLHHWHLEYRHQGKEALLLALGRYPDVSPKEESGRALRRCAAVVAKLSNSVYSWVAPVPAAALEGAAG